MQCSFCDNPAAHPSNGTHYTKRYIACYACTSRLHTWLLAHINGNGRGKKAKSQVKTKLSFHEAAALYPPALNDNKIHPHTADSSES